MAYDKFKLIDYGIQDDESDYRVHICLRAGVAYLFPTESAREAIATGRYEDKKAPATQPGVDGITAWGYKIPSTPLHINDLVEIEIPDDLLRVAPKQLEGLKGPALTQKKGELAEWIGKEMRKRGLFAPYVVARPISIEEQLKGLDDKGISFQYKMDLPGGNRILGGSGNLYIQYKERNVLKLGRQHQDDFKSPS